ncbi:MAG: DNA-binding protein WhiA [Malacoplasma sp.]|nr:DNA-binding protein WhiA [Malacoplasma sp.]
MTFTQIVKEELCKNSYDKDQKKSILSAFLKNSHFFSISNQSIEIDLKNKSFLITKFIFSILNDLYANNKNIKFEKSELNNNSKFFHISFVKGINFIKNDLFLESDPWNWLISKKVRSNFIAGLFLHSGSINNPNSSNYHFEMKINNISVLKIVKKVFKKLNIPFSVLTRKKSNILYVKKSESISDILKLLGANESMFEFEEKRISRDYTNQISRLNNLDISNLKKSIIASRSQIHNIEYIKSNNFYNNLSEKEKIYCELKLKFPDSSLNDLVLLFKEKYNITISKSGINHIVRKIKSLSE